MPSLSKSHEYDEILPVDWSVNLAVRGAVPFVTSAINAEIGGSVGVELSETVI